MNFKIQTRFQPWAWLNPPPCSPEWRTVAKTREFLDALFLVKRYLNDGRTVRLFYKDNEPDIFRPGVDAPEINYRPGKHEVEV